MFAIIGYSVSVISISAVDPNQIDIPYSEYSHLMNNIKFINHKKI